MKLIVESGCFVCIYLLESEESKHLRDFRLPLTLTEIYKMSTWVQLLRQPSPYGTRHKEPQVWSRTGKPGECVDWRNRRKRVGKRIRLKASYRWTTFKEKRELCRKMNRPCVMWYSTGLLARLCKLRAVLLIFKPELKSINL